MSTKELIQKEITRLEKRGSSDWQSLIKQVNRAYKPVNLNTLQAFISFIFETRLPYKITEEGYDIKVIAARGTGKSTNIADVMRRTVKGMPRSVNILQGETYQQILTRTFPSTIHGLELFGLYQGLHYFVGRQAPKTWRWPIPYKPPLRWDKVIHFWTGAVYVMTSQDVVGDGRSLNADSRICDETQLLNKEKLDSDSGPAVRGSNIEAFEKSNLLLHEFQVGTMPLTEDGFWFLTSKEEADNEFAELERIYGKGKVPIGKKTLFHIKSPNSVNAKNLPKNYNKKAKKTTLKWIYDAEYENEEPQIVKDGFYAMLRPQDHYYNDFDYNFYQEVGKIPDCRGDRDLTKGVPLILGVDWGAQINCLTVSQHLKSINEFRTIKSMYVLGDDQKIQDDLFVDFDRYYKYHDARTVYVYYDNQGNQSTGITKETRAQKAARQLRDLGWTVILMTQGGRNDNVEITYLTWGYLLRGGHPFLPNFRMNKSNCKELAVSMRNAKIKQEKHGITKDKSSEKSANVPRQHATDLSDAHDKPVRALFGHLISASSYHSIPLMLPTRR